MRGRQTKVTDPIERLDSYPVIDENAKYKVKNQLFCPIPLTITNPSRTRMQTLILASRESVIIDGSRMTHLIFEQEKQRRVTVEKSF